MSPIVRGSLVAGLVSFVVSACLFVVVRLMPDDLGRGVLLTFIGIPIMVVMSLWGGWLAAVKARRVIGVFGVVVAVVVAVLLAGSLLRPVHGSGAGTAYLIVAGVAAISTAAGFLISVAGLSDRVAA